MAKNAMSATMNVSTMAKTSADGMNFSTKLLTGRIAREAVVPLRFEGAVLISLEPRV